MVRRVLLLDMDCVLTDFVTGALAAHGLGWDDVRPHWPAGTYGMTAPVGRAKQSPACGRCNGTGVTERSAVAGGAFPPCRPCGGSGSSFTEADFWRPISEYGRFWYDLKPLPWARDLVRLAGEVADEWYVVTSPSRCPGCVPGKQEWLGRLLGVEWTDKLIPTPHKHLLAKPGVVLVDDMDRNCERFRAAGGAAVVFPAYHNSLHDRRDAPLRHVQAALFGAWDHDAEGSDYGVG